MREFFGPVIAPRLAGEARSNVRRSWTLAQDDIPVERGMRPPLLNVSPTTAMRRLIVCLRLAELNRVGGPIFEQMQYLFVTLAFHMPSPACN